MEVVWKSNIIHFAWDRSHFRNGLQLFGEFSWLKFFCHVHWNCCKYAQPETNSKMLNELNELLGFACDLRAFFSLILSFSAINFTMCLWIYSLFFLFFLLFVSIFLFYSDSSCSHIFDANTYNCFFHLLLCLFAWNSVWVSVGLLRPRELQQTVRRGENVRTLASHRQTFVSLPLLLLLIFLSHFARLFFSVSVWARFFSLTLFTKLAAGNFHMKFRFQSVSASWNRSNSLLQRHKHSQTSHKVHKYSQRYEALCTGAKHNRTSLYFYFSLVVVALCVFFFSSSEFHDRNRALVI